MTLSRHLKRSIIRLLMAVALFAQWSAPAAVYAATPVVPVQAAPHAMSGMPCHEKAPATSACIVHCSQADQASLDHAQLAAPASTAVWQVAAPVAPALASGVRHAGLPRLAAGPPLSILYCSFLN